MTAKNVNLWWVFSIIWMGVFSGIAHGEDQPVFSGFPRDYSDFAESPHVKGAWFYIKPGKTMADLKQYNKVILEPVQVYGGSDDVFKDVDTAELEKAAKMLHKKIAPAVVTPQSLQALVLTDLRGSLPAIHP